jgi:hypothetical protein
MSNQAQAAQDVVEGMLKKARQAIDNAEEIRALTVACATEGYTRERMTKLFKLTGVPDEQAKKILDATDVAFAFKKKK